MDNITKWILGTAIAGSLICILKLEHFHIENRAISDAINSEESVVTYDGDTFLMRKIDVNNDEYSVKEQIKNYMMTSKKQNNDYLTLYYDNNNVYSAKKR